MAILVHHCKVVNRVRLLDNLLGGYFTHKPADELVVVYFEWA